MIQGAEFFFLSFIANKEINWHVILKRIVFILKADDQINKSDINGNKSETVAYVTKLFSFSAPNNLINLRWYNSLCITYC
jgi:hypothetical protein